MPLLAVVMHVECLVFSIGEWVFLYPELQFDSLECFLYRLVASVIATFPDLYIFVFLKF